MASHLFGIRWINYMELANGLFRIDIYFTRHSNLFVKFKSPLQRFIPHKCYTNC